MFSFVVCSIHPQRAEALRRNLEATVGVPFELIVKDNRGTGKGICRVYNEAAAEARFDLIGFLHEDIAFRTPNWGPVIAAQLRKPTCGAIGFAGSSVKSRAISGWAVRPGIRENYAQPDRKHPGVERLFRTATETRDFAPAVCLDGLCLFVRREVWSEVRFDEETFRGFHSYDLDFTTAVARRYRNYVCMNVGIVHFSAGAYTRSWVRDSLRYHDKWRDSLPMFADKPLSPAKRSGWSAARRDMPCVSCCATPSLRATRPAEWYRPTSPATGGTPHLAAVDPLPGPPGPTTRKRNGMGTKVKVVIPIHRETLTPHERRSLRHNLEQLRRYPVAILCPEGMPLPAEAAGLETVRVSDEWLGRGTASQATTA